ncbi:ABC transporter ATP-binding protein [Halolamina sp. CBA1230]|uniref:ABC transporter ATP-binding protein n=1 Tax=Halolamina sp. CBA1230 TaxID=1853690 RepID=UPI0009A21BB3|nr:ABC transporter ATP-binding protein [Halolamina sp. CBA1230]QKY19332.1 ABC transporter ATP-binding protein [Halolamina sp. CBA1230]
MSAPAVDLRRITKQFPGVLANDEVDLTVERGSVHALLGENGAGKTTLMNVLYGLYQPTDGTVVVDGEERTFDSPRDAIDAGIGMIHQHFMLVEPMTVTQNVVLGNEPRKWGGLAIDRETAREDVAELADRYGFDVDPEATVGDLSVGEQQRIEILKALYRGADTLILDEPTAVLTPQEVEELFDVFDELTEAGKTIIFITHKLSEVTDAADEVTVLRDGKNVGTVDVDEVDGTELAEMMVGREVLFDTEKSPVETGSIGLAARDLVVEDDRGVRAVDGVDLRIADGEVFGVAGVDGNGQSELVEAITGLRTPVSGRVYLGDEDVTDAPRRRRIENGMAYVPEDRQTRGLVMSYDLTENGLLGSQRDQQFADGGRIRWGDAEEHAEEIVEEYDVRPADPDATATSLSGGNQQKFIVGREFSRDPSAVVASHPTRGVDVGSVEFIHDRLLELRDEGAAVLLVSSKLDEVRSLSDRLGVMHDGELVDVVDPAEVTEEQLGLLMAGEEPEDVPQASRRNGGER